VPECRSLGVRAPGEPALFDLPLPPLGPGSALVETLYSGFSAGTELTYVKGTAPDFTARRDPDLGVFVPGEGTRRYPITAMGYMEVGRVVQSDRPDLAKGALVAAAYGHRSAYVLGPEAFAVPVPPDVDPLLGVHLAQMGPICANGLLHAAAELNPTADVALGDGVRDRRVLVTGAGVVGLLTALFAVEAGAAEVAVADPDPQRLAVAAAFGAEPVDERDTQTWRWCKERWVHGPGDRGADVVFQCRGRSDVLHEALRSLRPQGTVIDLAFYQGGAPDLRLGEEFHHNGLTIRCAQIGRVPRGLAGSWDRRRLAEETGRVLAARGDLVRRHLVTAVVPVEEAPALVAAVARRERSALGVVFTFDEHHTA
jgi:threonine dehydrogenase-like Zn-dependent dehydrogenase